MFREFAIDPDLARSSRNRLVFGTMCDGQFGWGSPRLVVPLPDLNSWRDSILADDQCCNDTESHRIVECYSRLKENYVKQTAREIWDSSKGWLENAEIASEMYDFHAILSTQNPRGHPRVLVHPDHVGHDLWNLPDSDTIPRTAERVFEVCIRDMARFARRIEFLDPHFNPMEERYLSSFREYLGRISDCSIRECAGIEIRCKKPKKGFVGWESKWKAQLRRVLPERTSLRVVCVDRSISFHNRYILCEYGGLGFGNGFDCQFEWESDNVHILSENEYNLARKNFRSKGPPKTIRVG